MRMTKKKLIEQIRAGLGQGHGKDYQPWLKIRRRNPSPKSNQVVSWMPPLERTCHYFSRGEYHTALLLMWLKVDEIREQYPLWPTPHPNPMDGSPAAVGLSFKSSRGLLQIAKDAGIDHGVEVGTKIPYVATLDFMVTVPWYGQQKLFGFSSKGISDSNVIIKERTLERLELERLYMEDIDGDYLVTNASMVPTLMAGQLEWWLDCATLHCAPELLPMTDRFAETLNNHPDLSLVEVIQRAANLLLISMEEGWLLFRHCAWSQLIDIDPSKHVLTSYPIRRGGCTLRSKLRKRLFGRDWQ